MEGGGNWSYEMNCRCVCGIAVRRDEYYVREGGSEEGVEGDFRVQNHDKITCCDGFVEACTCHSYKIL